MPLAVIFDMDGLMFDTERVARCAWRQAMEDQGFEIEDSVYLLLVGRTAQDGKKILSQVYGEDFPYRQVNQLRQGYYAEELAANGVPVKPGLFELLQYLKEKNIKKAVASSTARKQVLSKLVSAGVSDQFEVVVGGDDAPVGKPAPDLFLEAARQLGVSPHDCLVLEDSEPGIRAAYAAGMLPVMIPDLKQPSPDVAMLAYRILPALSEVTPLLECLWEKSKTTVHLSEDRS